MLENFKSIPKKLFYLNRPLRPSSFLKMVLSTLSASWLVQYNICKVRLRSSVCVFNCCGVIGRGNPLVVEEHYQVTKNNDLFTALFLQHSQLNRVCKISNHRGYIVSHYIDKTAGAHFNGLRNSLYDLRCTILEQVKEKNDLYRKEREKCFMN